MGGRTAAVEARAVPGAASAGHGAAGGIPDHIPAAEEEAGVGAQSAVAAVRIRVRETVHREAEASGPVRAR